MKKHLCFKVMYFKKIIAIFTVSIILSVALCGFFFDVYQPYIKNIAIGKADYILQKIHNEAIVDVLKKDNYDDLINIIRDSNNKITGIQTNTVKVNMLKSKIVNEITNKLNSIKNKTIAIPLLAFLRNPFILEKGPVLNISIRPISITKTELNSTFISEGVNQTKHQLDLICKTEITIVLPSVRIKHKNSTLIPISQTIIVGEVPQSYTNVTTSQEKLDDTVLQLAGN